jgi:hypothetical protein
MSRLNSLAMHAAFSTCSYTGIPCRSTSIWMPMWPGVRCEISTGKNCLPSIFDHAPNHLHCKMAENYGTQLG